MLRNILILIALLGSFHLSAQISSGLVGNTPRNESKIYEQNRAATFASRYFYEWPEGMDSSSAEKWYERIYKDHWLSLDSSDFGLVINPQLELKVGTSDELIYTNARGVLLEGKLGDYLWYNSGVVENQSRFVDYVSDFVADKRVAPGSGYVRDFKEDGYDYAYSHAELVFHKPKYHNIHVGYGKQFIGHGHRSLFLSDNSFHYPYLKIHTHFWRINYYNLWTSFANLGDKLSQISGWPRKNASFHVLNIEITKKWSIDLFEGIVWQAQDSTVKRGFDVNYLNPLIFYRPVEFSMASADNAMLGIGTTVNLHPLVVYGQFLMDDFNISALRVNRGYLQQKVAFQLGAKAFQNLLGGTAKYLLEYNHVRPYTYAHKMPGQNFAHYGQPLAHPLGANFDEWVAKANWQNDRWKFQVLFLHQRKGQDDIEETNYGGDIFKSDYSATRGLFSYGNLTGQGTQTNYTHVRGKVGYIINPANGLSIDIGVGLRQEHIIKADPQSQTWFYVSLNNLLFRQTDDF